MSATFIRLLPAAVSAVLLMGLALPVVPIARADDRDDAYVMALRRLGIRPVDDGPAGRAGLVDWAHWSCDQLERGADPQHVVSWLDQYNPGTQNDFGAVDALVLREATHYYCPAYEDRAAQIARRGQR